eukprot:4388079-Amphidinium_carterae.1
MIDHVSYLICPTHNAKSFDHVSYLICPRHNTKIFSRAGIGELTPDAGTLFQPFRVSHMESLLKLTA